MAVISNTRDNPTLTKQNLVSMLFVSQPSDATKNVTQSINYKVKLKQSEFKWYAKKILGFEHLLSKIRDIEENCLLIRDTGGRQLFAFSVAYITVSLVTCFDLNKMLAERLLKLNKYLRHLRWCL